MRTRFSTNPVGSMRHALRRVFACSIFAPQAQLQAEQQRMEEQQEQLLPCLAQRSLEASAG